MSVAQLADIFPQRSQIAIVIRHWISIEVGVGSVLRVRHHSTCRRVIVVLVARK